MTDTEKRIALLLAFLDGHTVKTAKGRAWGRGQEPAARKELARLLSAGRAAAKARET